MKVNPADAKAKSPGREEKSGLLRRVIAKLGSGILAEAAKPEQTLNYPRPIELTPVAKQAKLIDKKDLLQFHHEIKTAEPAIKAMAEKFNVPNDDFALVKIKDDEGPKVIVAYTGKRLLDVLHRTYLTGYNLTAAKRSIFTVEVGDQALDTRTGLTRETYGALICALQNAGEAVPDKQIYYRENSNVIIDPPDARIRDGHKIEYSSTTYLTGESEVETWESVRAYVDLNGTICEVSDMRHAYTGGSFRPALLLPINTD